MKKLATVLCITFIFTTISFANAVVKAGTSCTKVGTSSIVSGKKYTCIKSGKKIVWDKGVVLKVAKPSEKTESLQTNNTSSSPSPSPSSTIAIKNELRKDSRISTDPKLSDVIKCKIADLTYTPDFTNGFPRPESVYPGSGSPKVLVLPLNFTDLPFSKQDFENLKRATDDTASIYKKISYGKLNFVFEFAEEKDWVMMPNPTNTYELHRNIPQFNRQKAVEDAFANVSRNIDFDKYDGVILESGWFRDFGGGQGFPGMKFKTNNGIAKRVNFEFGEQAAKSLGIAHELGHSFFGFEDIYLFENYKTSNSDGFPAGPWDFMTGAMQELFGWSRFLMGSLEDDEVVCVTNQDEVTTFITNINTSNGPKLIIINIGEGKNIILEARSYGEGDQELLTYDVDTSKPHGGGPITASSKLYKRGNGLTLKNYKIRVLDSDSNGLLVNIQKIS